MGQQAQPEGRLVDNIVHFARALRRAGLAVGTSQVQSAISAVAAAGFTRREDFYYTLRATLVSRPEHLDVFHQIFRMFWRDPEFLERMVRTMLPLMQTAAPQEEAPPKAASRRAAQAMWDETREQREVPEREVLEIDAEMSWSRNDILRRMDFEQMSQDEARDAARLVEQLRLPVDPLLSRRFRPARRGASIDAARMMKRALRRGGEFDRLLLRTRTQRPPDLVVICDISGSMAAYARMMMHFLHALSWGRNTGWGRVFGFTFGTRLTNVSRALALRDPDSALAALGDEAPDWKGGTRIGEALMRFNRDWSRRVLGRGAVVLLITDGLERGDVGQLQTEAAHLHRACRRLIWLNPLLRWQEFAPRAAGIRTLLPIVDSFHPCHNIDSLAALGTALGQPGRKQAYMKML